MTDRNQRANHHFHLPDARSLLVSVRARDGGRFFTADDGEHSAIVYGRGPQSADGRAGHAATVSTVLAKLPLLPGRAMVCAEVAVQSTGFTDYEVVIEPIAPRSSRTYEVGCLARR